MKQTHSHYDLAVAYVKGELSGKALSDFEIMLADDEALREEVLLQRTILSAARLNITADTLRQATHENLLEDKTLHPQIEIIQKNMKQARIDNINRQRRIRRWLVSSLAVAACVFGTFFFSSYIIYNQKLYEEIIGLPVAFENPNPGFEEVRGVTDAETHIQNAEEQYAEDDRKAALASLDMIPEDELPKHILLAKGKIQAQLKNYRASKQLLLLATESEEVVIQDDARFALGMVHLRLREKEEAEKQFMQISDESKKRKAEEVMQNYLDFSLIWNYKNR